MDWRNESQKKAKKWISERRNKALVIGVLVLIAIVILQVENRTPPRSMAPLFAGCDLKSTDLQRMQIALSKSGLANFEITNGQILVPQEQKAKYLETLTAQQAVPLQFQQRTTSSATVNPFLTHAQQVSLERQARKQKIQELLMLLPFVEQAWFEMDDSVPRGSSTPTEKSAVVSLSTKQGQPLLEQQIYTVNQLVCGAINGLQPDRVVIVDLTTGFTHQGNSANSDWERKLRAQQAAYYRQQQLETRLKEALNRYPGLKVSVLLQAEDYPENQTALTDQSANPNSLERLSIPELKAPLVTPQVVFADHEQVDSALVGANGQVSLLTGENDDSPSQSESERSKSATSLQSTASESAVQLVAHATTATAAPVAAPERATVIVNVPERLLLERFGDSEILSTSGLSRIENRPRDVYREKDRALQNCLERLKPELDRIIKAVLSAYGAADAPIVYQVVASEPAALTAGWSDQIGAVVGKNWPSLAVLLTGLVLIGLMSVSRKREMVRTQSTQAEAGVIRLAPTDRESDTELASTKVQLSQMIEKDPDAAARVIEKWVRDAA